eukprot:scaffold10144_cov42-Prasinocladus_malaysianus.AAC.1
MAALEAAKPQWLYVAHTEAFFQSIAEAGQPPESNGNPKVMLCFMPQIKIQMTKIARKISILAWLLGLVGQSALAVDTFAFFRSNEADPASSNRSFSIHLQ